MGDIFAGRLFNRRLEECRGKLYRMAYAWSHNRHVADDLTQQTLVKALEKRSQLREADKLEQWVFRILANTLRDAHRQERRFEPLDDCHPAGDKDPGGQAADTEIVQRVRCAVARLPITQRQVLTLVDLEECSYADVAAILDIPMGTVMSRLSRARQALKNHLDDLARETLGLESPGRDSRLRIVK